MFTEKQEALAYMKKKTGSRLKVFHSSTDVKRFRAQSSKQAGGQDRGTEPKVLHLSANALRLLQLSIRDLETVSSVTPDRLVAAS